jgi:hypothetical protein
MISLCDPLHAGRLWGQVGIDRPVDADEPEEEHSADHADVTADGSRQAHRASGAPAETRGREEYAAAAHAAAPAKPTEAVDPKGRPTAGEWDGAAERFYRMWAEYHRRWPPGERTPVDRSDDLPGSWRGDSNRFLDSAANSYVDDRCDRIAEAERDAVSPAMRAIESCDPDRCLTGFDHRLKDRERIKDKVATYLVEKGCTVQDALSMVKDPIRYTFEYSEERYAQAVRADLGRLEERGFKQVECRNSWTDDQYKGINSRWREPVTGQLFEIQFHTRISFEAKQLTHSAYERLRSGQADEFEELVLEAFQKKVTGAIPIPPHAADIPDYPKG